jgi:hypothetical protein
MQRLGELLCDECAAKEQRVAVLRDGV